MRQVLLSLVILIVAVLVLWFVLGVVGPLTIAALSPTAWTIALQNLHGYPWFPAIILSIGLVSFFAFLGSFFPPNAGGGLLDLILRILTVLVDPRTFPSPVKWSLGIISLLSLMAFLGLLLFPPCISSGEILVSFRILRGADVIATLSPGGTAIIRPNETVILQGEIEPVSSQINLPILECAWINAGGGGKLLYTRGCRVNYQSGQDQVFDAVSLQLTQRYCPSLELYPFFIKSEP